MASIREDAIAAKAAAAQAREAASTEYDRHIAEAIGKLADATIRIGSKLNDLIDRR
ncbi:hypothetical protein [Arthrobacter sp. SLBN-53]|uniref:hypothetical protein n=1 Tax=Arthrobacter sp. SLBN-53 TaxID=2768412 RepID=UPI00116F8AC9|nr:hypothetical protein [Arthrobacter sp. SLBN-53]TQK29354.1 hypothetical protein FBY28_2357 [Arthrobacter sp. SLBN-53]